MAKGKALKAKRSPAKTRLSQPDDYSPREAKERFERAVDIAVATKPLHKPTEMKSRNKRAR